VFLRAMSTKEAIKGSCLCGSIKFTATCQPSCFSQCHCTMCRKCVGSASSMFIAVNKNKLTFHCKDTLKTYRSSKDDKLSAVRGFCGKCGCSLFMDYDGEENTSWLMVGALDTTPLVNNPIQVYIENKVPYFDEMNNTLGAQDPDDLQNFEWDSGKNV
ncbi:unnamed protein product, partial [Meganyctiphanes norvegica]